MIGSMASMIYRTIGRFGLARSNAPALMGLVLPLLALLGLEAGLVVGRLALLVLVILGWQVAFRRLRGQPFGLEGLVSAMLLALLTPPDAPYWQLILGASFGILLAELAFGGRGRNFLHPVVVALGFLMFSFAGEGYRAGPHIPLWALAPALALLLLSGQATWRILVPAAGGIVLASWGVGSEEPHALLLDGAIWTALLFLAADPVASAATNAGRLVHGTLIGVLSLLFAQAGDAFGAMVFAILLASIFAPLIDQCVIMIHLRLRERRRG